MITRKDLRDAWRAAREAFTWPLFWSMLGVAMVIGILGWIAGHSDPRYRHLCSDPSDFGFLMFFLSMPIIGVCGLVGLGEGIQWGQVRHRNAYLAREHLRRAAILLGVALCACLAAGLGLLDLCHML